MSAIEWILVIFGTLGFLAIGSFTCVIIARLPVHLDEPNQYGDEWDTRPWREVLGGTSHCAGCGERVRPYDNIPVIGWLVLRGKCRSCGDQIPGFHPIVELLSPLLFLVAVWVVGFEWSLLPLLWLIPVGLAVAVIDIQTLIVPTRIVWPAFGVSVALTVLASGMEGQWSWLLSAFVGLVTLAGPLFIVWFILPSGMGFGDVRLATLLGWSVGFSAGTRPVGAVMLVLICMVLAAVIGIVVGVTALGARGRKAKVPFGPALVVAAYLVIATAPRILQPFDLVN